MTRLFAALTVAIALWVSPAHAQESACVVEPEQRIAEILMQDPEAGPLGLLQNYEARRFMELLVEALELPVALQADNVLFMYSGQPDLVWVVLMDADYCVLDTGMVRFSLVEHLMKVIAAGKA